MSVVKRNIFSKSCLFICMCMAALPECISIYPMYVVPTEAGKGNQRPLELELEMTVSHHGGAWN